jgi:hypothetical protein
VKKTALLIAVSFGLLVSCKKNSGSSSSYHFTATIDGKAQTFNVSPLATRVSAFGLTEIAIDGFNGTGSSNIQVLSIGWTAEPPSTAKFGTGNWSDTSQNYATIGTYVVSTNEQYVTGSGVTGAATVSGTKGINDLKITITSLDSTAVKGTFSGDFYFMGDISGTKKTITNGDFYVAWKK